MGLFEEHPWLLVLVIVVTFEAWIVCRAALVGVIAVLRDRRGRSRG
jgi:hypothetical protein